MPHYDGSFWFGVLMFLLVVAFFVKAKNDGDPPASV